MRNARRTLTVIIGLLALLLAGIAYLAQAYGVGATIPGQPGYESVLARSANTGFADFPRLCRIIAQDNFLPHTFASRGRRLVFSSGILVLGARSGLLLVIFGGITDRLIPLFAVGAFLAFTLSQAEMVAHWRKLGGRTATRNMLVNGVGAAATLVTLAVVLVAKFREGAWLTLLIVPLLLVVFLKVQRHYARVRAVTACVRPLDLADLAPPIVVVPVRRWDLLAHKALRFALKLSPEVYAVQVGIQDQANDLQTHWEAFVAQPARQAGLCPPQLVVLESPYRRLFAPLLIYIEDLKSPHPDRQSAVIIPELVEHRWYHYLLHNQRAEVLKTLLLLHGDQRIVLINVPWYLRA